MQALSLEFRKEKGEKRLDLCLSNFYLTSKHFANLVVSLKHSTTMTKKSPIANVLVFLICLAIPLSIGFLGSMFTMESVKTWYTTINKPSFNPPNWVFAPVWTTLYVLMGIASFRVWQKRKTMQWFHWAVIVYIVQLVFNLMWSFIFFELHQIGFALIEIVLLLLLILINAFIFYRFDKLAGWLFLPYFLWVSFATYLTYAIFILN